MSDFSIRLKEQMDKAGLRAIDISNATGINRATISQYLSGKYVPKQDKLLKIASVLNIKPSELVEAWDKSEATQKAPSQNLLELLFKDNPTFLKKISHIEMTGKINEPGIIAKLTKQQQDRIKDIIMLTYEEAVRNGGIGVVHTTTADRQVTAND